MRFNKFFDTIHIIAVVGLSDKPQRYSYLVASYLKSQGFRIIPVNPNIRQTLGEQAYPDLLSIPKNIHIDVVDIFRPSDSVLPHVEEAIKRGDAKTVWMQEGVENDEAKRLAEQNGITVVMNFCLMKAHKSVARV